MRTVSVDTNIISNIYKSLRTLHAPVNDPQNAVTLETARKFFYYVLNNQIKMAVTPIVFLELCNRENGYAGKFHIEKHILQRHAELQDLTEYTEKIGHLMDAYTQQTFKLKSKTGTIMNLIPIPNASPEADIIAEIIEGIKAELIEDLKIELNTERIAQIQKELSGEISLSRIAQKVAGRIKNLKDQLKPFNKQIASLKEQIKNTSNTLLKQKMEEQIAQLELKSEPLRVQLAKEVKGQNFADALVIASTTVLKLPLVTQNMGDFTNTNKDHAPIGDTTLLREANESLGYDPNKVVVSTMEMIMAEMEKSGEIPKEIMDGYANFDFEAWLKSNNLEHDMVQKSEE